VKIAVYGTLRYGGRANGLMNGSTYLGKDRISARLYDLGSFPGIHLVKDAEKSSRPTPTTVVDVSPSVVVDVYDIPDELIKGLDRYEGYVPHDEKQSLYVRKNTTTLDGGHDVQVYEYNAPIGQLCLVPSGDWFNARFTD